MFYLNILLYYLLRISHNCLCEHFETLCVKKPLIKGKKVKELKEKLVDLNVLHKT